MIRSLRDFVPAAAETGAGLALEDDEGRLLFFLAGRRHTCPAGEAFFAGPVAAGCARRPVNCRQMR